MKKLNKTKTRIKMIPLGVNYFTYQPQARYLFWWFDISEKKRSLEEAKFEVDDYIAKTQPSTPITYP